MKKFICLLIVPLLVLGTQVYADSVYSDYYEYGTFDVETTSSTADYGFTYYDIVSKTTQTYYDSNMTLSFNGKEYTAHCLDPGLSRPTGDITCKPINRNPAVAALGEMTNGGDDAVQTLSYRIWAVLNERTNQDKEQKSFKQTVEAYSQIMTGNQEMVEQTAETLGLCGGDTSCDTISKETVANKLFGDDVALFQSAWAIATAASELGNYEYDKYENTQGRVSISSVKQEGTNVTIRMSSGGAKIPEEDINVVCKRGCSITNFTWSEYGYGGTLEISVTGDDCKYELEFYYPTEGSYECTSPESNTQTLYTYVDEATTSAAQTYEGTISGEVNGEVCETCCTMGVQIKPGEVFGSVNNCCWNTHSEAYEYDLNDLFCEDENMKLKWWKVKCNADHSAYKTNINDFCDMYCTERVTVDLPGTVTASSGRYFQLQKNPVGNTTSPYIEGYKRCRVKTDFKYWVDSYRVQLDIQINSFNEFQKYEAQKRTIEKMDEYSNNRTVTITCKASAKEGKDLCEAATSTTEAVYDEWELGSDEVSWTVSGTIKSYKTNYVYMYTTIKQVGPNDGDNYYNEWKIEKNSNPRLTQIRFGNSTDSYGYASSSEKYGGTKVDIEAYKTMITDQSSWTDLKNDVQDSINAFKEANPYYEKVETCKTSHKNTYSCTSDIYDLPEADYKFFEMEEYKENFMEQLPDKQQGIYNAATSTAKKLEEELELCTDYFNKTPADKIYQFSATSQFSYSQTYLDDKGELVRDEIQIPFTSKPGCSVSLVSTEYTGETEDPQYSEVYSKDPEKEEDQIIKITDMKEMDLEVVEWYKKSDLEIYFDEEYEGQKKMTNDGLLRAVCEWNEGTNTIYTLAQTGVATETTQVKNFTIHERQYQVHLTTLEGTFETFWRVNGLGTGGKFDSFFMNAGNTCAGEKPASVNSMFTCMLKVEHEVVLTGYCNGVVNGNGEESCDPFKEGYELVNFKVVDPADLFPSVSGSQVPSYEGQTYGHNWVVDEEGKEVLGIIEEKGKEDLTYAPENLSYAFTLTPNDMQHIKNYNESRIQYGGYTDFNLTCDCPSTPLPLESTESCSRCKSEFLENLAAGKISYGMGTEEVSGWANGKESLGTVRNGNNW